MEPRKFVQIEVALTHDTEWQQSRRDRIPSGRATKTGEIDSEAQCSEYTGCAQLMLGCWLWLNSATRARDAAGCVTPHSSCAAHGCLLAKADDQVVDRA